MVKFVIFQLALVAFTTCAFAQFFTSMAEIVNLLKTQKFAADILRHYLDVAEDPDRRIAKEFIKESDKAERMGLDYLSNPITAFLTIKRLSADWTNILNILRQQNSDDQNGFEILTIKNITEQAEHSLLKFPDQTDLEGAAVGLMRLQDVYGLKTSSMANGRLGGLQTADTLKANDCFILGRVAHTRNDFYHALMWLKESLDRLKHENPPTASEPEVLEYLAYSMYAQGNANWAVLLTKRIHEIQPERPRIKSDLEFYKNAMVQQGYKKSIDEENMPPLVNRNWQDGNPDKERYEALCRGKLEKFTSGWSTASLLELQLERASILDSNTLGKVDIIAGHKISKTYAMQDILEHEDVTSFDCSAWLEESVHPLIAQISKRVNQMTNLDMKSAQRLQVANYGLGGHYMPHIDFIDAASKHALKHLNISNCIATVLFYLSQPAAGGHTVFPALKLAVKPVKNDALFWFNLHKSGDGDMSTMHAACPVLAGIKWISNKWMHEEGQEFIRPCGLHAENFD